MRARDISLKCVHLVIICSRTKRRWVGIGIGIVLQLTVHAHAFYIVHRFHTLTTVIYNILVPQIPFYVLAATTPYVSEQEIHFETELVYATLTANIMASMVSRYPQEGWPQEGGDPCLPASWSWVQCSSEAFPRLFSMYDNHVNSTFNF